MNNTREKNKKTLILIISIVTMLILLCGCGQSESTIDSKKVEENLDTISKENEIVEETSKDTSNDIEKEIAEITPEQESSSKESDLAQEYINSITIDNAEAKGICGSDLMWFYKDNVLVIRGTGDMTDFGLDQSSSPWRKELKKDIHWVIIEDGCTYIGKFAFNNMSMLSKVIMPNSLQVIGERAFEDCESLIEVNMSNSLLTIESLAFQGCSSLTEIDFPDSLQSIGILAFNCCDSLSDETIQRLEALGYVQ